MSGCTKNMLRTSELDLLELIFVAALGAKKSENLCP
jgi:hypothetical protein